MVTSPLFQHLRFRTSFTRFGTILTKWGSRRWASSSWDGGSTPLGSSPIRVRVANEDIYNVILRGSLTVFVFVFTNISSVLGIAENVVAPAVTSVVPFSDPVAGFALSVTNNAGQLVHAVGAFVGIFMPADKSFGILKPEEMTEDELDIYVERCRALEISSLAWTTFGFAYGMLKDIFTLNVVKYWTWACALLKTNGFLWTSGIGVQLLATLPFFLSNAIILHKVQAIGREESTSAGTRPSKNTIDNGQ
jgi:hypothetical protein